MPKNGRHFHPDFAPSSLARPPIPPICQSCNTSWGGTFENTQHRPKGVEGSEKMNWCAFPPQFRFEVCHMNAILMRSDEEIGAFYRERKTVVKALKTGPEISRWCTVIRNGKIAENNNNATSQMTPMSSREKMSRLSMDEVDMGFVPSDDKAPK